MSQYMKENMQRVIGGILADYRSGRAIDAIDTRDEPDRRIITQVTDLLFSVIYPGFYQDRSRRFYDIRNHLTGSIEDIASRLSEQIENCLRRDALSARDALAPPEEAELHERAQRAAIAFFERIPRVRDYLSTDLAAFFDGDPAAENLDEIILCYPGFYAITVYRMAHELYNMGIPVLPRIMTEYAHTQTGIDINPGAVIGRYFFIDHGTGIVIGETTQIGEHVKIYQGVTLGALSTSGGRRLQNKKRHPTIEDFVTIYSGASILGGETVIGRGSIIGGNVFITRSVKPGTRVSVKNQELRFDSGRADPQILETGQSDAWC